MKRIVFLLVSFIALANAQEQTIPAATETAENSSSSEEVQEAPSALPSTELATEQNSAIPEGFEDARTKEIKSKIQYSDDEDLKGIDSDDEGIDPDMFVTTSTGNSNYNFTFDAGAQFGMYYQLLTWHSSFSIILWRGVAEINIPFTYQVVGSDLKSRFTNPKHTFISTALKYRKWMENEDNGFFYGAGMRMHFWMLEYDYVRGNQDPKNPKIETKTPSSFFVFTPQIEAGYDYSFSRHFGVRPSLELGYSLSASNQYEQATDIDDTIDYLYNELHINLIVAISYSW